MVAVNSDFLIWFFFAGGGGGGHLSGQMYNIDAPRWYSSVFTLSHNFNSWLFCNQKWG